MPKLIGLFALPPVRRAEAAALSAHIFFLAAGDNHKRVIDSV
jgi:hypothetical protein